MVNNFGWNPSPNNGGNNGYGQQFGNQNGGNPGPMPPSGWQRQNPTPSFVPGRIVGSLDDIKPQEVPMDGNPAVFLKADGSVVWVKIWTANGTIDTSEYRLKLPETSRNNSQNDTFQSEILDRLNKIESMIKKNNRPCKPYSQNKREVKTHDESSK